MTFKSTVLSLTLLLSSMAAGSAQAVRAEDSIEAFPPSGAPEQTVYCASEDQKPASCYVGRWRSVWIQRQRSDKPCYEGSTWNYDGYTINVRQGCRADFALSNQPAFPPPPPAPRTVEIHCTSNDYKYAQCWAGGWIQQILRVQQKSNAACIYGRSYGVSGEYLWVDRGCEAKFLLSVY